MKSGIKIFWDEKINRYVIKPIKERGKIYSNVDRIEIPNNHEKARVIEQWLCDFGIIALKGNGIEEILSGITEENRHELIDFGKPVGREVI